MIDPNKLEDFTTYVTDQDTRAALDACEAGAKALLEIAESFVNRDRNPRVKLIQRVQNVCGLLATLHGSSTRMTDVDNNAQLMRYTEEDIDTNEDEGEGSDCPPCAGCFICLPPQPSAAERAELEAFFRSLGINV